MDDNKIIEDECDHMSFVCSGKANILHVCPYREQIYDDTETLCNCCHNCIGECLIDLENM